MSETMMTLGPDVKGSILESRGKTSEELLYELQRHPLFMTKLPDTKKGDDCEENAELEALKCLAYEGGKLEVGQNFREQGNECAREGRWRDARGYYTQALDVLNGKCEVRQGEDDQSNEDDGERIDELKCTCYANRSLAEIKMENFASAARDANRALQINTENEKALYRLAKAHYELGDEGKFRSAKRAEHLELALLAIERAKLIKYGEKEIRELRDKILERKRLVKKLDKERHERVRKEELHKKELARAILSRKWIKNKDNQLIYQEPTINADDAKIQLLDGEDGAEEIVLPILVLYPMKGSTDFLKSVSEMARICDILSSLCGENEELQDAQYQGNHELHCYVFLDKFNVRRLTQNETIDDVIRRDQLGYGLLQKGILELYVVRRAEEEDWVRQCHVRIR